MENYGGARQAIDDNKTRRTRFAFWITTDTDTHTQNMQDLVFFSMATMVTGTRLGVTLCINDVPKRAQDLIL